MTIQRPTLLRGTSLQGEEIRRMSRVVETQDRVRGAGTLASRLASGPLVAFPPGKTLLGRITDGSPSGGYTVQALYAADGALANDNTIGEVPNCFEINSLTVPVGVVVRIHLASDRRHWTFATGPCCWGGIDVGYPPVSGGISTGGETLVYGLSGCCPELLLPRTMQFTITDMYGDVAAGCDTFYPCFVGEAIPLDVFGCSVAFVCSGYSTYFNGLTDPTGCLANAFEQVWIVITCSTDPLGTYFRYQYSRDITYTYFSVPASISYTCTRPFTLSGTMQHTFTGSGSALGPCYIDFTLTE